jgi:hypothetical protein
MQGIERKTFARAQFSSNIPPRGEETTQSN